MNARVRMLLVAGCLALTLGAVTSVAQAASVTVALPDVQAAPNSEVKVPIQVRGAQGMGPFQMDLTYDPVLLAVKTVSEGDSILVGLFDFNVVEPGRLRVVMTGDPKTPVRGDGELLVVTFQVHGEAGKSCTLGVDKARAWEQTNEGLDMRVAVEPGTFTVSPPITGQAAAVRPTGAATAGAPWLLIGVGLAVFIAAIVAILAVAMRRRKPAGA